MLSVAGAQSAAPVLPAPYPSASRGDAAIEALGDRLHTVAAQNELTAAELTRLLRDDPDAWIDHHGRVFFVDAMPSARPDAGGAIPVSSSIPTSDAFKLHSRPEAARIIYLDFTGHHSVNNSWGHNIVFPPFNTEGSPDTFSEGELLTIIAHWQRMAEDFAPFDVDVTTEEPPTHRLIKSGGGDQQWGVRDVHTQSTAGFGDGIGGVAFLNSYNDSVDNPVFSFNKGDNNGSMTGSHEVGHSLGLSHDGLNGASYHPGTGSGETGWGPIMGAPFGKSLTQWSNGDYSGSTTTQDDYGIITKTTNGLTIKPDDFGDGLSDATPLALGSCPNPGFVTVTGLIETRNDRDSFRFDSVGGLYSINADPISPGGNLDILLELYGPSGQLVASSNPASTAGAGLSLNLPVGPHTLVIDGVGKTSVYSDYGCVGVYSFTVSSPDAQGFTDLGSALAGTYTPILVGLGVPCAGTNISLLLASTPANAPAILAYGVGPLNAPFLGGTLVPNIGLFGGTLSLSTNVFGIISIGAPLPGPVPSGVSIVFQYWVADSNGPQGYAASNAVELAFP